MKKIAYLCFLTLISLNSWAQMQISWPEDLSNPEKLNKYSCANDVARNNLFTPYEKFNAAKDSLRVKDEKGNLFSYKDGDLVPLGTEEKPKKYGKLVLDLLKKIEATSAGAELLKRLQASPFEVTIQKGRNSYDPSFNDQRYRAGHNAGALQMLEQKKLLIDGLNFWEVGAGGRVFFYPDNKTLFEEEDGEQRLCAAEVILTHELYHAYDGMRGLLDRRIVYGPFGGIMEAIEFRATRMENTIRQELGKKKRTTYGSAQLLGPNGELAFIDDLCLSWL